MKYENIISGHFIERPNRFIARFELDGKEQICHVKNTGRCKELLTPKAKIYLQRSSNPHRKTAYDLIAVKKGQRLINMDSAAPNKVFGEFLAGGGLGFVPDYIRAEYVHGDSRFDFYFEHGDRRCLAEVKGVTLEEDGVVRFPDAPTERGIKHLSGLQSAVEEGFECYAVFIIQMEDAKYFEPNRRTHPAFAQALEKAAEAGVRVLAYDCRVEPDSLEIKSPVEVRL